MIYGFLFTKKTSIFQFYVLQSTVFRAAVYLYIIRMCSIDNSLSPNFFPSSLKLGACYITSQWGELKVKLHWVELHFFALFLFSFCLKNCFFRFHFFSWWKIKFPLEKSNQSETWIGGKKLLVKLYIYSEWTFLSRKKT